MSRPHRSSIIIGLIERLSPITFVSLIIAGTVWLTTVKALTEEIKRNLRSLEIRAEETSVRLDKLNGRISNLEGKIDLLIKR